MKGKILERLLITDIADEGRAFTKHNGLAIFVKDAMPGDVVDVLIKKKRSSYLEGEAVLRHESSENRIDPFCKHFGICGGCKWQNMRYDVQLQFKQNQVLNSMMRIGKLENPVILPIIGSALTKHYRNKLDYSFADKKWLEHDDYKNGEEKFGPALGFHIPGRFDKVLDVEECFLQPEPSNSIRNVIKKYALEKNLPFINLRHRAGLLRSLIIRNTLKGEWMVIVMVFEENKEALFALLDYVKLQFPLITSLLYVINPKANDTMHDLPINIYSGTGYIVEEMEGLQFRIGPKSFFQTNPSQAYILYQVARDFANITGKETVYDLYTGTGTIANFVAKHANKVVGIENVPEAIEDAKVNSRINNINNTSFFAGDMKDLLTESFFEANGYPDIVVTDPPRNGMHFDVVSQLIKVRPNRIVYVSCNPATQARDIELLKESYRVLKMQPVDMFPHTAHVENVALLERI